MRKKLMSIALCLTMVVGALAGCGNAGKDANENGKTTLTMWMPPLDSDTKGNFGKLLENFEEENNCEVDIELIPWDTYTEKWSVALSGGESPDIGYFYAEMYANYIASGAIEELSSYLTKDDYKEYPSSFYNFLYL